MSVRLIHGDCREVLRTLPDESVHCVVTSPPYFGLRDYGVDGQIGLEPTPDAYVAEMVAVFREVRRVLRRDGTFWLNLGDSYATGAGKMGGSPGGGVQGERFKGYRGTHDATNSGKASYRMGEGGFTQANRMPLPGLKPKDLIGIPWMVAFALRADGWWLRQDNIWSKPNPMPESVTDRCTKAHEYLFLLAKSERYFFDAEAIAEPAVSDHSSGNGFAGRQGGAEHMPMSGGAGTSEQWQPGGRRNRRSVWTVPTAPYREAHFATFPPALIEPCILAGCPTGGTVLDPFGGSGTTGMVADRLGRDAILIELNENYCEIAERRIRGDAPLFAEVSA